MYFIVVLLPHILILLLLLLSLFTYRTARLSVMLVKLLLQEGLLTSFAPRRGEIKFSPRGCASRPTPIPFYCSCDHKEGFI